MGPQPNCSGCPVLSNAVFRALPREERADALCLFRPIDAPPGSPFVKQGRPVDRIFALCRGGAKGYRTDVDGRDQVQRAYRPGDMIGLESMLLGASATTVETTTASRLCWADKERLLEKVDQEPPLARALLRRLSEDLAEAREEMQDLATPSPLRRVARYLLREADRLSPEASRKILHLPLSWRDTGGLLGLTEHAFDQAVGRLEDLGILARQGNAILLRAPDRLATLAGRPRTEAPAPAPGEDRPRPRPRLLA